MMRIITGSDGRLALVFPNGNFVRDTNCSPFFTFDRAQAEAALAYLDAGKPRSGAHWLKSAFGVGT